MRGKDTTFRERRRIDLAAIALFAAFGAEGCFGPGTVGSSSETPLGPGTGSGTTMASSGASGTTAPTTDAGIDATQSPPPGGATPEGGDAGSSCTTTPSPGAAPLRRLTQSEYNNTVRDLLGDTTHPADGFPPDQKIGDFSNTAVALTVPPLLAQAYQSTAEQLAAAALSRTPSILPCDPTVSGEDACAQAFIQSFGKQAYRRPLTAADASALFALYTTNRMAADFKSGVGAVIEAVLQSADFLYRVEFGDTSKPIGTIVPLTPYEMASRLSYFLWGSMPDATLFAAADANQLSTQAELATQARRMLQSPAAQPAVAQFFSEWLTLGTLSGVAKDSKTYPAFTSTLQSSMQGETLAFVDWVMWQSDRKLATLLTSPVSFVNQELAAVYGMTGVTGTALQQVQLDATKRSGILTQASLMTLLAKPDRSSPVLRGQFIRDQVLCETIPPPPQNIVIVPPTVMPGLSTRQQFVMHEQVAFCSACHTLMDPIGFGFENFDGIGRYRTVDQGQPIDATGSLTQSDVDGPFQNAVDLAHELGRSRQVSDCFATEWFRYTFGRGESAADACSLQGLQATFASAQGDIRELLVAVTQTDAFRYRPEVTP